MRAYFDDVLAAIFVLAVLAASFIFLFLGTVQSGSMMSTALTHRMKIEQLRSANVAFSHLTEPNTGKNLAELLGRAVYYGNPIIWLGEQSVNTKIATENALNQLLSENYHLSVSVPHDNIDIFIILPQSATMIDDRLSLLSKIPSITSSLEKEGLNASIELWVTGFPNYCAEWCDNSTSSIVQCRQRTFSTPLGRTNTNWAAAVEEASAVPTTGLKVIIPLVDSLSTGNEPDTCFTPCSPPSCSSCNVSCAPERSERFVQQAIVAVQHNGALACPIITSPCVDLNITQAGTLLSCAGISSSCSNCTACTRDNSILCFGSCRSQLNQQADLLAKTTSCVSRESNSDEIDKAILEQVRFAVRAKKFEIGPSIPSDVTSYSEDILLPVTPPLRARMTIW